MTNNLYCKFVYDSVMISNSGKIGFCCEQTRSEQTRADFTNSKTFDELITNNQKMQEVRSAFEQGIKHPACSSCWDLESRGLPSKRTKYGQVRVKNEIVNFDLRLGNRCNLQCKMCSPTSSDQIHNLKKEIEARGITTSLNNSGPILSPDEIAQLFSMMQGLNDIDAIKFAGGEPLLMPEVEEFVDTLIAHGQTNIRLRFITNATVFKEKWLERFNHFRAVDLLCSIDGVEDTVEYQRYPVKWETLDKNFRRYYNARLDCRLQVDLTPTISLLNFNGLPKFFDWASEFPENELSFGMVHHPSYLDYRLIPLKNREQTVDYLQTLDLDKLFNHYDPVWQTFLQDNLLDYRQITTSESQQLRDISSKVWDFRCKEKFLNRYPWAQELINAG